MIIKRIVDNKEIEIELTQEEMCKLFIKQKKKYMIEDVENRLDDYSDDERKIIVENMDLVLDRYAKNCDEYNISWVEAVEEAIYYVLEMEGVYND